MAKSNSSAAVLPVNGTDPTSAGSIVNLDNKSICFLIVPYIASYLKEKGIHLKSAAYESDLKLQFTDESRWDAGTIFVVRPGEEPEKNGIWITLNIEYKIDVRNFKDNAVWDIVSCARAAKNKTIPGWELVDFEQVDQLFERLGEREKYLAEAAEIIAAHKLKEAADAAAKAQEKSPGGTKKASSKKSK